MALRRIAPAIATIATLVVLGLPGVAWSAGRCGSHPWCDSSRPASLRADLLLGALTLDEKLGLMAGDDAVGVFTGNPATGTSNGVPRLGVPTVYYSDGPVGPREGNATAMPGPLALASSFEPALARAVGAAIANEVKHKGNDVVHAPTVDVMRTPLAGRTFEGYGEDPLVSSRLAVDWIRGAQAQGVIGNVKHFAPNSQEGQVGAPPLASLIGGRFNVDAIVDERTLREIYLPPFEAAVREAGVGSVMCAYNRINGAPACESRDLLERTLRRDWAFDGFVVSDYGFATKSTANSANNGLDLDMPLGGFYSQSALATAVATGQVSEATINRRVGAILRTMFRFGVFDRAAYASDDARIDKAGHARVAREVEEAGIVMLENRRALPLSSRRLRSIAVVGEDARRYRGGGGSSAVRPFSFTSPLDAITRRAGPGVRIRFDPADDPAAAARAARGADVAIVFASDRATEGADKPCLAMRCTAPDPYGGEPSGEGGRTDPDAVIRAVAAANPRTVVVLETSGPVLTSWASRVEAVLEAWYPGQEGGAAIARVLFGDVDPGGRLPVTFPVGEGDVPTAGNPRQYPGVADRTEFSEGVLVGYRHYDARRIRPRWPFGHGLSFTQFEYRDLEIRAKPGTATVEITVRNVGNRTGTDVPQLYLGMPSRPVRQPPRWLRAFEKVRLRPGGRRRLRMRLNARSLSYWNAAADRFEIAPGCYTVEVARSSRDIRARGPLAQRATRCPKSCAAATGRLRGRRLGRVRLGARRSGLRNRFPSFEARRARLDVFCLAGGRRMRVRYGTGRTRGRAVLALSNSRRYTAAGVRTGSRARRLAGRARPLGRVGRNAWFVRRGRSSAVLFRVRRGRVREVSIATRRLTRNRRAARKLVRGLAR